MKRYGKYKDPNLLPNLYDKYDLSSLTTHKYRDIKATTLRARRKNLRTQMELKGYSEKAVRLALAKLT